MSPTKEKLMKLDDSPRRPAKGNEIPRRVLSPMPCSSGKYNKEFMEGTKSESDNEGL
ncbi:hypothetical protein DPMN_117997 [Dreissena polymorpha]|uniref:Uncharacterized protein n=1 Tax=Dreissena polymorpha TaxID=45954 RepID=A0A9D4GFN4_DREPO|nr:hypothetical protein DPMN_117997 [Dreissena polymorpha]